MRPFLIWRKDWLLGQELLDEQHLKLAEAMNELHHFVMSNDPRHHAGMDKIYQWLVDLMEMTRRHIEDEEELMRAHGYPEFSEHHREHVLLLAELRDCIREIETGTKPFSMETLTALKHWQIDHVLNSDREFVDYLDGRLADSDRASGRTMAQE